MVLKCVLGALFLFIRVSILFFILLLFLLLGFVLFDLLKVAVHPTKGFYSNY